MSEAETVWDWPYLKVMSGHNGWYTFIMMKRVTITEGGRNGLFLLVPPDKSPSLNPPSRHDYHHQACRPPRLPNVGHLSPSRPMAGARWHRVNDGINYVHDTSSRRLHCTAALTQSPSPAPRARTRSGSSNDRIWRTYDSTNLSLHHHIHIATSVIVRMNFWV